MELDDLDIRIVKRVISDPGTYQTEIYRPFLSERSEFFLHTRLKQLEVCGFLRREKAPGVVRVWATKKAARHVKKLDRGA